MFRRRSSSAANPAPAPDPASAPAASTAPSKPKSKSRFSRITLPYSAITMQARLDMTPTELDALFAFQTSLPNPLILSDRSFLIAGVAENMPHARRILESLRGMGVVGKDANEPPLKLDVIDRHFPNRFMFLTGYRLKRLVTMLFEWEKEVERWERLGREEKELSRLIGYSRGAEEDEGGLNMELSEELKTLKARRRCLPSLRRDESVGQGQRVEESRDEPPPAYYA